MEKRKKEQEKDLWVQLRDLLATRATGYATAEDGVELEMLKHLFTEEQARLYLDLEFKMEPLDVIAKRLNRDPKEVKDILDAMISKGLAYSTGDMFDPVFYHPATFLPGFGDFMALYADHELTEISDRYRSFTEIRANHGRILRTIPIHQALTDTKAVAPYNDIRKIIEQNDKIALMPCFCERHWKDMGREVTEPMERCLCFGFYADAVERVGFGRKISREEAIAVLDKCDDAGLMHQPCNLDNPFAICNCGKSCFHIAQQKLWPKPADIMASNYFAVVDADACTGCEICMDRCHMDALTMSAGGVAEVNLDKCVGCGLCVTKCPTEAITLKEKSKAEQRIPGDTSPYVKTHKEFMAELAPYKNIIKVLKP